MKYSKKIKQEEINKVIGTFKKVLYVIFFISITLLTLFILVKSDNIVVNKDYSKNKNLVYIKTNNLK
jgi:uncharacterized membrane protein